MKSHDWAVKFRAVADVKELSTVLADYALETRELIDKRSANSAPKQGSKVDAKTLKARKDAVIEGAVREQRQKWQAICARVQSLTPEMFDGMMAVHLNDVKGEVKTVTDEKTIVDEYLEKDGRSLVTT